jgi:hypothetical protein
MTREKSLDKKEKAKVDKNKIVIGYLDLLNVNSAPFCRRGLVLVGQPKIDKLEFVKEYFGTTIFTEFPGKGSYNNHFMIIDCSQKRFGFLSIAKLIEKYHEMSYLVFTNSEHILCNTEILRLFNHLFDSDDYNGQASYVSSNGDVVEFTTKSCYIFLADRFPIQEALSNGPKKDIEYRQKYLHDFCMFNFIHDFDTD